MNNRKFLMFFVAPEGGNVGAAPAPSTPSAGDAADADLVTTGAPTAPPADGEPPVDDWRSKFEAQQKVNRDLERKLKGALPKDEAENLRAQIAALQGKESEYQQAQQAQAMKDEALAKANERIVKRAIREHAATRLSDPSDALKFLDLTDFPVGGDGDIDDTAVKAALDDLVKSKPYLAAQGAELGVIESVSAGRNGSEKPQITLAQLGTMSPAQIESARKAGQLKNLGF